MHDTVTWFRQCKPCGAQGGRVTNEERERLQALLNQQAIMLEQGSQLIERALAWLAQVE
jgi:hypothetical protein